MITREQAIQLSETKFWETFSDFEVVQFQLFEERLCMPFELFAERLNTVFGTTFSDQELKNLDNIRFQFTQRFFSPVTHDHFGRSNRQQRQDN